jgi:hypothetical protein
MEILPLLLIRIKGQICFNHMDRAQKNKRKNPFIFGGVKLDKNEL